MANAEAHKLRAASSRPSNDITIRRKKTSRPRKCEPISEASGLSQILQRVSVAITPGAVWGTTAGAGAG